MAITPANDNVSSTRPGNAGLDAGAGSAGSAGSASGVSGTSDETLDRIVRSAHETVDRVAAKAAPVVGQVKDGVAQASDAVHEHGEQLARMGEQWTEQLRSTVREHPLACVAAALAAGMVLSRLSAR